MKAWTLLVAVGCGDGKRESPSTNDEACAEQVVYADADGDGFGDPFAALRSCDPPDTHVDNRTDCDDENPDEFPGQIWFRDIDGDGYGDDGAVLESCHRPVGYIMEGGDCDDEDGSRYPGALWNLDGDEDGFGDPVATVDACGDVSSAVPDATDCDDSDWLKHPDANEVCDGSDNNCDGLIDDEDPAIDIFTQVPVFRDADGDGYGTDELLGRACPATSTGAAVVGDCDDDDPFAHPYRLDYNDDHDADCDGESVLFDVSSTEYGWVGPNPSSGFGMHMKSKDINGDGLMDLLVSGHNYDSELVDAGSVHLVFGSTETDRSVWPEDGRWWAGAEPDGHFGYSLGFAGDWDGDGVEDLVVGAPYANDDGGVAYIFSSEKASGTVVDALYTLPATATGMYMGTAVMGVGDLNEDGLDDVLISARKDDVDGTNRGSVTVVFGGSDPDDETHVISGVTNHDQLGWDLVPVGDMDGDGVPEVAISSPYGDRDELVNNGGEIAVLATPELLADLPLTEDTPVFYGNQYKECAGFDMAALGDFDGDGLGDLIVGSGSYDAVEVVDSEYDSDEGAAYVVRGSSLGWESRRLDDAHLKIVGSQYQGKLGRYVAGPGDIDGDGRAEAFAASHTWDGVEENMGLIVGVLGGHSGGVIDHTAGDLLIVGESRNDNIGRGVAAAGDLDGDGLGDFWVGTTGVGATGTLYLVYGAERP